MTPQPQDFDSTHEATDAPSVLELATSWPTVRRALLFAIIVGSLLVCINHSDCCLSGHIGRPCLMQIALTVCVPYVVSTVSSVMALRQKS